MGILDCAADCADGALSCAESTALTLICIDCVVEKTLTYACGTFLINNVSDIFVTEEFKSSKNGVGSCLTETAVPSYFGKSACGLVHSA